MTGLESKKCGAQKQLRTKTKEKLLPSLSAKEDVERMQISSLRQKKN
jgi:hypothetical protein